MPYWFARAMQPPAKPQREIMVRVRSFRERGQFRGSRGEEVGWGSRRMPVLVVRSGGKIGRAEVVVSAVFLFSLSMILELLLLLMR